MNLKQKKLDEAAINSTFEDLLDTLGEILDKYAIFGYHPFFQPIKPFSLFFQIIEIIENEILVQWKIKNEKGFDCLFTRQQSWIGQELRSKTGFFFLWNQFCNELWRKSRYHSLLIHPDPWKSLLVQTLSDQDLVFKFQGNILADTDDVQLTQLCGFFKQLYSICPYHLALSFLNIIEIGVGTRPEISAINVSTPDNLQIFGAKNLQTSFDDILKKNQWDSTPKALVEYWQNHSGGNFSIYSAFLLEKDKQNQISLKGLQSSNRPNFDDLRGIEQNTKKLIKNTKHFIDNGLYHHVLLWGEKGTGKSSSVLSLINSFQDKGLRLIEVQQDDLPLIPQLAMILRNRKEHFVIYCNDLNFSQKDTPDKYLRHITNQGGLKPAKNILFIATVNQSILAEKSGMSGRFGLNLSYQIPSFEQLEEILVFHAEREKLSYDKNTLVQMFNQFTRENNHNKPTGQTVQHFIQEQL